ncbi:MAG TPA: DUF4375 domain-containing protein [Candidatus Sulfotelmatobacter sp.]|nr:DUF4375 domain-containing protein [Candidatus Sulfotelmatobacter sp.]
MNPTDAARLIEELEMEVNNGGFDPFFYNSAGDDTADIIQALDAVGAANTADILRRAAARFPGGMPPKDRYERQNILLEISPDAEAFEELDGEFCAYPDDLSELIKKYTGQ